jgi:IS5 family transposase
MRRFVVIDMISDRSPDETTILAFRYLLEKNDLGKQIFEVVKAHLKANGMAMKQGVIIDATLIAAPSPPKTRLVSGIRRCTRPKRATSGITASRKAAPTV